MSEPTPRTIRTSVEDVAPLTYPGELPPELHEALGMMIFESGPIAQSFRDVGYEIPRKVEAEQAFILHWTIRLVLRHGVSWRKHGADDLRIIRDELIRRKAATPEPPVQP